MDEKRTRTIVMMGKTGVGKSSLGNLLFGETQLFKTSDSPNSETTITQTETRRINNIEYKLVDTPGLFGSEQTGRPLNQKIRKGLEECQDGIDTFLFVFKVARFTAQEKNVVKEILEHTTEEALKYTTVVFTDGNQLPEGLTIKEWANEEKDLKILLEKCGGRVCVFDKEHWNNSKDPYRNNEVQKQKLHNYMETTISNNGYVPYNNEFLKNISSDKMIDVPSKYLLLGLLGVITVVVIAGSVIITRKKKKLKKLNTAAAGNDTRETLNEHPQRDHRVYAPVCPTCLQHHEQNQASGDERPKARSDQSHTQPTKQKQIKSKVKVPAKVKVRA